MDLKMVTIMKLWMEKDQDRMNAYLSSIIDVGVVQFFTNFLVIIEEVSLSNPNSSSTM